jgi:hypothetical protein
MHGVSQDEAYAVAMKWPNHPPYFAAHALRGELCESVCQ